jgi:hypothetical protein
VTPASAISKFVIKTKQRGILPETPGFSALLRFNKFHEGKVGLGGEAVV